MMCAFSEIYHVTFIFLFVAFIPARYILAVLSSVAMAIIYGLKVNLSVALVAMINHNAVKLQNEKNDQNLMSNTWSNKQECEAENRSSSAVNQVNK
jgi:energy-coupling factor transporter transmembrane protein EcfT